MPIPTSDELTMARSFEEKAIPLLPNHLYAPFCLIDKERHLLYLEAHLRDERGYMAIARCKMGEDTSPDDAFAECIKQLLEVKPWLVKDFK